MVLLYYNIHRLLLHGKRHNAISTYQESIDPAIRISENDRRDVERDTLQLQFLRR